MPDNFHDTLLDKFIDLAKKHGKATEEGDSESANKAHDGIRRLQVNVVNTADAFNKLCATNDPWVQLWAATFFIDIDSDKAIAVLSNLAKMPNQLYSLSARMLLLDRGK